MLKAKVADSPHAVEQGLMFVKDMPDDEGMLFVFSRSQKLSFWGRNTFIPLDIAFVDANHIIRKIGKIKPFSLDQVSCDDKCSLAIEANAVYFSDNGICEGDKIAIDRGSFKDDALISFTKTKDSASKQGKIKQSQLNGTEVASVVNKPSVPNTNPLAPPPAEVPQEQMEDQNLPVIDTSNIGAILEDAYDEEDQVQDGLDGHIDEQPQPDTQDSDEEQKEFPVFSSVFEAMEWGEQNLEVVRINYLTKHGRALVRDVEPHGKFHSKSTMKDILVTYDETVNGIRAFIASNIGNWAFVGRKFQKKFVVKA